MDRNLAPNKRVLSGDQTEPWFCLFAVWNFFGIVQTFWSIAESWDANKTIEEEKEAFHRTACSLHLHNKMKWQYYIGIQTEDYLFIGLNSKTLVNTIAKLTTRQCQIKKSFSLLP